MLMKKFIYVVIGALGIAAIAGASSLFIDNQANGKRLNMPMFAPDDFDFDFNFDDNGSAKIDYGKVQTKSVRVSNFTEIDASTGIRVIYTQGPLSDVKIKAPEKLLPMVKCKVSGSELTLGIQRKSGNFSMPREGVEVTITAPNLRDIELSSGASFTVAGQLAPKGKLTIDCSSGAQVNIEQLKGSALEVDMSSGSQLNISEGSATNASFDLSSAASAVVKSFTASNVAADLSSASHLELTGKGNQLQVDASSAASFKGRKFKVENATVDVSSTASVSVFATHDQVDCDRNSTYVNYFEH